MKLTKQAEAMRAKVTKERRAAHAAILAAEDAWTESQDRLARRASDQASSRAQRGLGVPR